VAVELFSEAFAGPVVFSGKAVDGEYMDELGIGQLVDIAVAVIGLSPQGFGAMIAVLQHEGSGIDSTGNLGSGSSAEAA